MIYENIKKGTKLEYLDGSVSGKLTEGKIYEAMDNFDEDESCVIVTQDEGSEYRLHKNRFKVLTKGRKAKKVKEVVDTMERYMVYGTGCNNKSEFYTTEKDMKEKLKKCVNESSWTGRIIGYKLTPLYEGEIKTIVKTFKKVRG